MQKTVIHSSRLIKPAGAFQCGICKNLAHKPYQCRQCGTLFCAACISQYQLVNKKCKNNCDSKNIGELSKSVSRLYNEIELKCIYFEKCQKILKLYDLEGHENNCQAVKCKMFEVCDNNLGKIKCKQLYCSQECYLVDIMKSQQDHILFQTLSATFSKPTKVAAEFTWDNVTKSNSVKINKNHATLNNNVPNYSFVSVCTKQACTEGQHYWQIKFDNNTTNQAKIGITITKAFDHDKAFSDFQTGYAYYGIGQLRNHSDSKGPNYGTKSAKTQTIGVYLNMNVGAVSFMISGKNHGVAFKSQRFTKGSIYPAVAILKSGGCTINRKPIPPCFKK